MLALSGPLTMDVTPRQLIDLEQQLAAAPEDQGSVLELDLAAVTETDSSALSLLLSVTRMAKKRQQPLRIVHPSESLLRLVHLHGLDAVLPLNG